MSEPTSTKPYLIRAIYEWCTDNGFTPYVAVFVNSQVVAPREYVKNGEIVLNVSFEATQGLKIANDAITFKARFAGVARDIYVPTDNVVAIYARENGQGMAFPLPAALQDEQLNGAKAPPHAGLHLASEPPPDASRSASGLRAQPAAAEGAPAGSAGPASQRATRAARAGAQNLRGGKPKLAGVATPDSAAQPPAAAPQVVKPGPAPDEVRADAPSGGAGEPTLPGPTPGPGGTRPALRRIK
jgi:stringent starvation protein B